MAWRVSDIACDPCRRAVRRDDRLRPLQSPGGQDLSRRCRQPADRAVARLVPVATGMAAACRRGAAAAAVLFVGCDGDTAAPAGPARAFLGSPPLAFLSARDR